MTMTFVEGSAGGDLDQIARSFVDNDGLTYAAAFTRACAEHPSLYNEYGRTYQAENAARLQVAEYQSRQPTPWPDGPGQATKAYANDLLDKKAKQIQAAKGVSYAQAFTEAVQSNPDLYDLHEQGALVQYYSEMGMRVPQPQQTSRQFTGLPSGNTVSWLNGRPAGSALLEQVNNALRPLQARYPYAERTFLLAMLFRQDKALAKRCETQCHISS
jgi:hypothetical protein